MLKTVPNFGQIIYVYDAFGRLVSEYAAGNEPSACHTCYLGTDHLGSTRIVTDETRAVVGRHDFMPFGEEIGANQGGRDSNFFAADGIAERFTGQKRDGDSTPNLDYFNARYFGAVLGRFLSADPANSGADPANPQSWNGYAYALGNPLANTDPTGTDTVTDPCAANPNCVTVTGSSPGVDPFFYRNYIQDLASVFQAYGYDFFNPPPPPKPSRLVRNQGQNSSKNGSCPPPTAQAVVSAVIASNPLTQVAALGALGLAKLRGGTAIVGVGGNASVNVIPGEPLGGSVGASFRQ